MTLTELVLTNSSGGELGRFPIAADDLGDINLPALIATDRDLALALEMLAPGDTLQIVERWSEPV